MAQSITGDEVLNMDNAPVHIQLAHAVLSIASILKAHSDPDTLKRLADCRSDLMHEAFRRAATEAIEAAEAAVRLSDAMGDAYLRYHAIRRALPPLLQALAAKLRCFADGTTARQLAQFPDAMGRRMYMEVFTMIATRFGGLDDWGWRIAALRLRQIIPSRPAAVPTDKVAEGTLRYLELQRADAERIQRHLASGQVQEAMAIKRRVFQPEAVAAFLESEYPGHRCLPSRARRYNEAWPDVRQAAAGLQ